MFEHHHSKTELKICISAQNYSTPLHSHSNVSIFIFQMKMFEAVRPLQTEIDQMRLRNKTLEDQTKSFSKEVLELQEV